MSKGWATIVYGRTYHLDFRLITVPHDFTKPDINWASQHIVATTQQSVSLLGCPRWSIFKNHRHCVVGVTCMVEDLIGDRVKDDQGRPLYIFVGYVAQLAGHHQPIKNLPPCDVNSLDNFKILYQVIDQVWLVKNYERDSRHPCLSQYEPINFSDLADAPEHLNLPQLNHHFQNPDKVYLWENSLFQNRLLWQASAQSRAPISTCLNIHGGALDNSPFLNQSTTETDHFQIINRVATKGKYYSSESPRNSSSNSETSRSKSLRSESLPQKISHRAKEDLDQALQQATKMAIASQKLLRRETPNPKSTDDQKVINNQVDQNQSEEIELADSDSAPIEPEFGFKSKKSDTNSQKCKQDWF